MGPNRSYWFLCHTVATCCYGNASMRESDYCIPDCCTHYPMYSCGCGSYSSLVAPHVGHQDCTVVQTRGCAVTPACAAPPLACRGGSLPRIAPGRVRAGPLYAAADELPLAPRMFAPSARYTYSRLFGCQTPLECIPAATHQTNLQTGHNTKQLFKQNDRSDALPDMSYLYIPFRVGKSPIGWKQKMLCLQHSTAQHSTRKCELDTH